MAFLHHPVELDPLASEDTPEGRYYLTPGGRFPSVTTVIGRYIGDQALVDWKARVGEDEAARVGAKARIRGTAVHSLAEAYLSNDPDWKSGAMPANLDSFLSIKKILDDRVGKVFGVEVPLWSSVLKTAGRTDLFAEWDGEPAIIDFKTSKKVKTDQQIVGYFIQEACYGDMVEERLGIKVPQIVTIMMVDHEPPIVWVKKREDFVPAVRKIFVDARRDV